MNSVAVFVGLDYHQDSVQVCVMDANGQVLLNRPCANHREVIAGAVHEHGPVVHAAIEACCGAADLAQELIDQYGWSVSLAHPGYVARIKQSPDKTDFADSRLLADLVRVGYLPKVWLAPRELRELRTLVRYRQQLVGERRNAKLRVRAILREQRTKALGNPWTKTWLASLETLDLPPESRWILEQHMSRLVELGRQIAAVEKRLTERTSEDKLVQKLLDLEGVGLVTAVTVRAEIGRFDRFKSGKQLARYCGLSPRNASSGQRQADAGLIKAGNPQLRAVLLQVAHSLKRFDDRWARLRYRLTTAGKPGSVIAAAVANRWVRWLYHQMQPENLAA